MPDDGIVLEAVRVAIRAELAAYGQRLELSRVTVAHNAVRLRDAAAEIVSARATDGDAAAVNALVARARAELAQVAAGLDAEALVTQRMAELSRFLAAAGSA